ncbi:MAG: trypsin-like peptidase domain-containing protein [Pirellulaceae bacterium]|nr:trypsin-like peptidase domain-containing protein [Pirellulaceae bacterium]
MTRTLMSSPGKVDWRRRLIALALVASSTSPNCALLADQTPSMRHSPVVRAIQTAEPAVVNIEGNKPSRPGAGASAADSPQVNGMGAGIIIDSRGYILTNQHVVQDVKRIDVTLHDGTKFVGRLIARDPNTDLALVKVEADYPLPVIRCGTSSDLMRGERVIAIGNPFGYHHTVTEGIISALHRDIPVNGVHEYPDLIQTDASINPGNSGGPLLNADGYMIGVNAAVRIGAQGIGFAIPIDRAIEVAAIMIAEYRQQAKSSVEVKTEYRDGQSWVRVLSCSSGHLQRNDIIQQVGDRVVANRLDYELALIDAASDQELPLVVERQGEVIAASLKLQTTGQPTKPAANYRFASTGGESIQDRVYRDLGVKLEVVDKNRVRAVDPTYRGGMLVTAVRPDSPARKLPLQKGDIVVGLMGWQTTSWNDLAYILNTDEMAVEPSPELRIIRGNKLYWSRLELGESQVR